MRTFIIAFMLVLMACFAGAQSNVGIGTLTPGSKLQVAGSFAGAYSSISAASYVLGDNDYYVSYTGLTNADFYLPEGAPSLKGRTYFIKNTQNSTLAVHAAIGEKIDHNTYIVLNRGDFARIVMNGNSGSVATSELAMISGTESKSWNLTGNSDVIDAVHYIGSNNNAPLNFRVNGEKSGRISTDGITSFGYLALNSNGDGYSNSAFGFQALFVNSTGHENVAMGWGALAISNGNQNTAFGNKTLMSNTTGSNNTAIGYAANVGSDALDNATAIGSGAVANASNKVRIGNSAVTVIEGQVAFSFPSDGRYKKNVSAAGVPGLDFILKLKPVSYNFDYAGFARFTGEKGADAAILARKNNQRELGFIAQDVERLVKETGVTFNAVHSPSNPQDNYSLSYIHFVMPLVKAVQEQQETIRKQQVEIDKLKATNTAVAAIQSEIDSLRAELNKMVLNQNLAK